jgi:hypothetical protein
VTRTVRAIGKVHIPGAEVMVNSPLARDIEVLPRRLPGFLAVPEAATGIVVFAHGSGSSRLSPRNQRVAQGINKAGLATLLFDLLHPEEAEDSVMSSAFLLATRLRSAGLSARASSRACPSLFGASRARRRR